LPLATCVYTVVIDADYSDSYGMEGCIAFMHTCTLKEGKHLIC